MEARRMDSGGTELTTEHGTVRVGVPTRRNIGGPEQVHLIYVRRVTDARTGEEIGAVRATARGWIARAPGQLGTLRSQPQPGPDGMRRAAALVAEWKLG